MSDSELAALLGEPPRKRRAAAVAAQKNWQMLSTPEDIVDDDEDLIITEHIIVKQSTNTTKIAQNSNFIITNPVVNRTSLPNKSIVDLNRHKKPIVDRDYSPTQDLELQTNASKVRQIIHPLKARKSFPTPVQNRPLMMTNRPQMTTNRPQIITNRPQILINKTNIQNVQRIQIPNRAKPQETILIEGQTSRRVIVKTNDSNHYYRKPNVVKLVAGEPQDFPTVEGDVEEIIGTYSDDKEVKGVDDDIFEELSLVLFCESESEISKNTKDKDDIEIIEIIDEKSPQNKPQNYSQIKSTHNTRLTTKPTKGQFDPIIDTLEMECDNFDDDFTDGLLIDCEEDILSETQWKQSVDKKKEYMDYTKSLLSAKNVKFLPEDQVTEPIGIVTTTISETTRVVTKPVIAQTLRIRKTNPIQSIRTPIPSLINQTTSQRSQGMRAMVTPPQISTPNRMPITLIPVSSSSGVNANPLILAPPQGFVNSTGLSPGLGFILQGGLPNGQPTYLMLPPSTIPNTIGSQNIIISNGSIGSAVSQQNIINPSTNQSIQLSNTLQPQYRPRFITQTVTRPVMPTAYRTPTPLPRPVVTINRSVNNSGLRLQTYSNVNKPNVTQNVIANQFLDCLTVFKGTPDSTKKITIRSVLTIKPLPFSWPSNIDDLINSLIKLDNALMKEKFKESPISWMVSAKLIVPPKCKACRTGICNKVSKTLNAKNEFWHCNSPNCNNSYPIERPRIFNGLKFDIPVSKLLFLIYYWSIQVDVEDLIKTGQIEMGTEKIYNVWSRLQRVCSTALQVKDAKLSQMVEICSIQVGRFHVLGAMEIRSSRTKLTVIPISDISGLSSTYAKRVVMAPFVKWLERGTQIMTCEPKFQALIEYGFKVTLQSKNAFLAANKNLSLTSISGYLIHHLQRFFKDFELSCLTNDILSNILDELLWRERYGSDPFSAFYNIIKHISEQCGLKSGSILKAPTLSSPSVTRNVGKRTGPTVAQTVSRAPVAIAPVLDETNSIFVDEYYYSSLTLKTTETQTVSQEETVKDSIQCHLCQMFFDNILIVKHLLEHLEKERRGRVRKGDNNEAECKHCLRFFSNRALHLHEELANLKVIPFSCRICLLPLLARQPFIGHMKTSHFSGEMPYYCDICCYRSSFQKSLFDHFEANHSNSSQVMCHYCIRVFDVTKFKNFSSFLYRHLTSHYAVASVYDCDKCSLTFTTKPDLKEHCFKGHNPSNSIDDKFEITSYVVTNEEKSLSIRAKEQELFTPFLPTVDQNMATPSKSSDQLENENISCEISCEPIISDYFSIEPEIEINLIDTNSSVADFILAIDCDYTNDQLKHILITSFDTTLSEELSKTEEHIEGVEPNSDSGVEAIPEPSPELEKDYILSNDQRVVCIECKTQITADHFNSKMVCEKCNFTTHCRTAFDGHTTDAHNQSFNQNKQISVLRDFPQFITYKTICKVCGFCATDGNQFALHMIQSNHFKPICKPLDFEQTLEV